MLEKIRVITKKSDWVLLVMVLLTIAIGILFITSATHNLKDNLKYPLVQGAAVVLGFVALYIICSVSYEEIAELAVPITIFYAIFLVLVLIVGIGQQSTGTQGWFYIGGIGIQPSEFAKVGFIIALSRQLDTIGEHINQPLNIGKLLLHLMLPVGLILMQPDFGTAVVMIFIFVVMLFVSNIHWKYIIGAVVAAVLIGVIAWNFILEEYQLNRIMTFLNPSSDLSDAGYHVDQAKLALGSGMIFGKGLFKGTQTQLGYLPAQHTDFIFSVIGEEGGIVMCLVVVGLLTGIICRCIWVGQNAKNRLGTLMCTGVAAMYTFHVLENICMNIGLAPVTGIPLTFVSYGGSSMLANLLALALVNNVRMRRKTINFY